MHAPGQCWWLPLHPARPSLAASPILRAWRPTCVEVPVGHEAGPIRRRTVQVQQAAVWRLESVMGGQEGGGAVRLDLQ